MGKLTPRVTSVEIQWEDMARRRREGGKIR